MDADKEKQLILQAQKDPSAFGGIFDEYYDRILRYTFYRTGNLEAARDITSETFYKALKNLWQYRLSGTPFSAWLYRIAGNETVNYFRSNKRYAGSLDDELVRLGVVPPSLRADLREEVEQEQEKAEAGESFTKARNMLEKLPQIYREVLVLRYLEGRKISETAAILGKKEGTVKSLISRGIAMLKSGAGEAQPFSGSAVLKVGSGKKE